MNKRTLTTIGVAAAAVVLAVVLVPIVRDGLAVRGLVARNAEARGGADAWEHLESVRLTGTMDIGAGLIVPFVLEQERPNRSCLEYEFDESTVVQCTAADQGWKVAAFTGRPGPQPLTEDELREASAGADPRGLLFDYRARGIDIDRLGEQTYNDRPVEVLRVTLPGGAERLVYLDKETGLELKVEWMRVLAGRERRVETTFSDWKATNGVLFARRQVTQTEGDDESHALVVSTVQVNTDIDDARFEPPADLLSAEGKD